ncbi:MAG: preprotein translocase subunit SecG [Candidatus Kapabacteria bacterium]|nr:preprotein translocase subunit SecG [Candidatus Kapabacteria bacterium]MDW8011965.1 preprotein translocase subunit SecG [Bacteroidota bacterium]
MFTVIVILMIFISVLLIAAVLIQPGRGELTPSFGGLGGQFGSLFGMRRTMDFLTKLTIGLGAALLILSVIANKFFLSTATEERQPVTVGAPASMPQPAPPITPTQPIAPPGQPPQGSP